MNLRQVKQSAGLRRFGRHSIAVVLLASLTSCAVVGGYLSQIGALEPTPASSVAEVIQRLQAIDAALPESDGLKWFNYLYLAATRAVDAQIAVRGGFADPPWIARLDVVFANLYFDAVRTADSAGPDSAPEAWRPLFKNRTRPGVARVQFALAGMTAHINRDLVFALLDMYQADAAAPDAASVRHADFTRINQILEVVEKSTKPVLLVGTPRESGGHLARLESLIVMWSVKDARQGAWRRSQEYWRLRGFPSMQRDALDALDRTTQLAGDALLVPVLPVEQARPCCAALVGLNIRHSDGPRRSSASAPD
jgi:uncharacterized protein DUF5995